MYAQSTNIGNHRKLNATNNKHATVWNKHTAVSRNSLLPGSWMGFSSLFQIQSNLKMSYPHGTWHEIFRNPGWFFSSLTYSEIARDIPSRKKLWEISPASVHPRIFGPCMPMTSGSIASSAAGTSARCLSGTNSVMMPEELAANSKWPTGLR